MSDPIRIADHAPIWDDGESLVERLDQLRIQHVDAKDFYSAAVSGLKSLEAISSASFAVEADGQRALLAQAGEVREVNHAGSAEHHSTITNRSSWLNQTSLLVCERLDHASMVYLRIDVDNVVDPDVANVIANLGEAIVQIATSVYLRSQYESTRVYAQQSAQHERWLGRLFEGANLEEAFAAIASAISEQTQCDRVCLFRCSGSDARCSYRLVAASAPSAIDRRAQQVRLQEQLVCLAVDAQSEFSFQVGSKTPNSGSENLQAELKSTLDSYLIASGGRRIQVSRVDDQDGRPIAAVWLEDFKLGRSESVSASTRDAVASAITLAVRRDEVSLSQFGGNVLRRKLNSISFRRKSAIGFAIVAAVAAVLILLPMELKLPVDGRIVAKQRRSVFAPQDARVVNATVPASGHVKKGDPLFQLRSSKLDLLQQQIQGELTTAKTQLNASAVSRPGFKAGENGGSLAGSEQVLRAQISSLQEQLNLVLRQQERLSLNSPIDGLVSQREWQQDINGKPVRHGETLLQVLSPEDGWAIELDIPAEQCGYVVVAQDQSACLCTFRLLSNPDRVFKASLSDLGETVTVSPSGNPILRASIDFNHPDFDTAVSGASVRAWVHCGKHPAGFVWFRGLFQWARRNGWL